MHDQAEDRCHRIGQHDAVTAWYLLAAQTIDETMIELIERKRRIVDAVTDGRTEADEAVLDGVIRALRGRARPGTCAPSPELGRRRRSAEPRALASGSVPGPMRALVTLAALLCVSAVAAPAAAAPPGQVDVTFLQGEQTVPGDAARARPSRRRSARSSPARPRPRAGRGVSARRAARRPPCAA